MGRRRREELRAASSPRRLEQSFDGEEPGYSGSDPSVRAGAGLGGCGGGILGVRADVCWYMDKKKGNKKSCNTRGGGYTFARLLV